MTRRIKVLLTSLYFMSNACFTATAAENTQEMTVANYLKVRLESLGLKRIFGVAGNYTAPFLDTILEDPNPDRIQITGTSNELCAGYAADGYSRILGEKGLSAIAVTYGVGAFSVLNAVAGSFVEQVPVVVINGAPTNKEFTNQRLVGLLYSHMMPNPNSNIDVFRSVTAAAEQISNANEAPLQIDAALTACMTRRQPVYLEIFEDVWRAKCIIPFPLRSIVRVQSSIIISDVEAAVEQTLTLIQENANKGKSKPIFWAGIEIQRLGLQDTFLSLLKASGLQYTTAVLGKSLVSEDTPGFSRVGLPINASCVIGLGAWTTGKDIGSKSIIGDRDKVIVSQGSAFVGGAFFPNVPLEYFMNELQKRLQNDEVQTGSGSHLTRLHTSNLWANPIYHLSSLQVEKITTHGTDQLDYDKFFKILDERWIRDSLDTTVVVDSSFPLIASQQGLHIKSANGFVAQASWLSIGYAAPAAIGIKCAIEDNKLENKRMIVIAGDGAFQETCQAVSSYGHLKQNTIVFIIANGIYGIEQKLVNPNPFREPPNEHSDKKVYEYNDLCLWNYEKLVNVFGAGEGLVVENVQQLTEAISVIQRETAKTFIVHVKIPKLSIPVVLKGGLEEAGEDECTHPNWPPKNSF